MRWPWQRGHKLRDGSEVTDKRLGRVPSFDVRSQGFGVARLLGAPQFPTKGRSWWTPHPYADQKQTPRCVAYAGVNALRSSPVMNKRVDDKYADYLYARAQEKDEWAGSNYDGTSGLGLAKALMEEGWIDSYYWAFSVEEIILALAYKGPVLVGWPWFNSMFEAPKGKLTVDPDSGLAGYHEVLLRGFSVRNRTCRLVNQWGENFGLNGEAHVSWDDMRRHLLPTNGDALVLHEIREPQ